MSSDHAAGNPQPQGSSSGSSPDPQCAIVECSAQNCDATRRIENAALLSVTQINKLLHAELWAWDPVKCPAHNDNYQKQFEIARISIAKATEQSLRLLVIASGVSLHELNERFPKIHDEMTHRSASAAVRALLRPT